MAEDILTAIHNTSGHFSKGQRAIANYIAQSYDKAAFMTASKLGKTVGVSESTVVRFAVELGYDGYPSMQRALQELQRQGLVYSQRTSGRFVTEETDVIENAKRSLADEQVRSFLDAMARLGYMRDDILRLLEARIREESGNGEL